MARTWSESDWHKEKLRIAREAAKNRMSKKKFENKSQTFIDAVEKELFRKAVDRFDEDFKYDALKDTEKDVLSKWKAEDADNYLLGGGNEAYRNSFNPLVKKKQDDFSKLGPLVLGLADKGRDWYSMGQEDLFNIADTLGYDVSTKKGKMDFLRDVGDVQQAYDRGKLLEEFNRKNGILSELFWPTVMEEARKQISTGRGTEGDLWKAGALDAAANGLIAAAPLAGEFGALSKSPFIGGTAGAVLQGALEGGRQYGKTVIDPELEADVTPILAATTLGATRPGMIGSAAALSQQVPGRAMSRFSRGVSGATRRGNPTYMERDEFGNALDILLGNQKGTTIPKRPTMKAKSNPLAEGNLDDEYAKVILSGPNAATYTLSEIANARRGEKALEQLETLYGTEKAKAILNNLVNKEKVLKDYDELSNLFINRDRYNAARKLPVGKELINGELREGDVLNKLEQAFPSKMAEAYGNDKWYKAGLRTGKILGDVGGSVEPVIKVNPLGWMSGGRTNIVSSSDYKETKWYKSLSKKQQEAFDDAYEKAKKQAK